MKATYHVHCDYCDGRASAGQMARAAREAGFGILGFSSHAPLGLDIYSGNMKRSRLGDYLAEIRGLSREYAADGLEVLVGLEIDWLPGTSAPADPEFAGLGLDFKIGSAHLVDLGGGPFAVDDDEASFDARVERDAGGDGRKVWRAYYQRLCELIEAGGFDVLGHHDLVTKNNRGGRVFDEDDPGYRSAALEAARLLAGRGIVAEVNYGGMSRGKTDRPYPAPFILRELRELGVPVTLSADAHAPGHLQSNREAAREAAQAAGYRSVAVLTKGSWIEVGIDEA